MRPIVNRLLLLQSLVFSSTFGLATAALAQAESFPSKPIKLIVPVSPGGPIDYLARAMGEQLAKQWTQSVVIENRAGAGGTIGLAALARSPADGYTLALGSVSTLAVAPSLYAKLPYDPLRDVAPVVLVAKTTYVLTINSKIPAKNVQELLELARSKKPSLTYCSAGPGSMSNVSGELLKTLAGIDLLHVPYKGTAPCVTAAVAGELDIIFPDVATAKPFADAGKLRMLAATDKKRSSIAPELPTIAEAGVPGYAVDIWYGIVVPAATPAEIVAKLNRGFVGVLSNPEFRKQLAEHGFDVVGDSPEHFGETIKVDIDKFARIIKSAGIKGGG